MISDVSESSGERLLKYYNELGNERENLKNDINEKPKPNQVLRLDLYSNSYTVLK